MRSVIATAVAVGALYAADILLADGRYAEVLASALLSLIGK